MDKCIPEVIGPPSLMHLGCIYTYIPLNVDKLTLDKIQVDSSHFVPDVKGVCFTRQDKYEKLQCFGTIPAKYIKA